MVGESCLSHMGDDISGVASLHTGFYVSQTANVERRVWKHGVHERKTKDRQNACVRVGIRVMDTSHLQYIFPYFQFVKLIQTHLVIFITKVPPSAAFRDILYPPSLQLSYHNHTYFESESNMK